MHTLFALPTHDSPREESVTPPPSNNNSAMTLFNASSIDEEYSPVPAPSALSLSDTSRGTDDLGPGVNQQFVMTSAPTAVFMTDPASTASGASVPRVVSTLGGPHIMLPDTTTSKLLPRPSSSSSSLSTPSSIPRAAAANQHKKPTAAKRRQSAKRGENGRTALALAAVTTNRRQKRLERNRESARLSRRRRKQYLEILEERVKLLSMEMDQGRREHTARALVTIQSKRLGILNNFGENYANVLHRHLSALDGGLSRTSQELMIVTTFLIEQLKSFTLPPGTKFLMWLTLQSDAFFRGGRASSERLSAARIGERMLSSGTDRVTPAQSMWPLFCNEIGLSYDQEEKVRSFQHNLLLAKESWLDRHTAFASGRAMEAAHTAVQAVTLRLGQRERSNAGILTAEQRLKFLMWAHPNRGRIAQKVSLGGFIPKASHDDSFVVAPEKQHVAANLYVLNHRFQKLLTTIPPAAPFVTGGKLKKLSRRPSFESLRCVDRDDSTSHLSRENSFASCGSLKRSASEMSIEGGGGGSSVSGGSRGGGEGGADRPPSHQVVAPEEAQAAAAELIEQTLGHLKAIMPATPTQISPPTEAALPIGSMMMMMSSGGSAGASLAGGLSCASSGADSSCASSSSGKHVRKSSFLPAHLNVVPEDIWPDDAAAAAEEFLMGLIDEDWAIGEGIDMELQHP